MLRGGEKRLADAEQMAKEAQWRVDHAQEEEARALREAEANVRTARQRVDAAEEALRQKQCFKETLRLEAAELAREVDQIKVRLFLCSPHLYIKCTLTVFAFDLP